MAKYTTELRYICESLAGYEENKGYASVSDVISNSRAKIFNFNYPIFDANYKSVLETKILKHYYGREIGAETFGRWQLWLDARMNEIMPYYNKLYESELLEFNPLHDVDLTITKERQGTSNTGYDESKTGNINNTRTDNLTSSLNSARTDNLTKTDDYTRTDNLTKTTQDSGTESESGSDVNKNTRWDVFSDTPQGALTDVQNETYLTNARKIIDDGSGSTKSKSTTFGKKVTENDTGTVKDGGTSKNTGTQELTESQTNTGTQTNIETQNLNNTSTTDVTSTEDYLEHITGKNYGKSFSELLVSYREAILNIDTMVINDLSDLFMGLW